MQTVYLEPTKEGREGKRVRKGIGRVNEGEGEKVREGQGEGETGRGKEREGRGKEAERERQRGERAGLKKIMIKK